MDEKHGPMIARDIMISNFSFVAPEDKVGDVIQLLRESRLGAVSVIDGDHRPIGIITRSNVEGSPLAAAEIAAAPPSFLLRTHGAWRAPTVNLNRHAREVMTTPTISVPDVAKLFEIARIMETHRLKRIPVMSGARMVGMVNLARVMEAMAKAPATPAAASQVPHAIERAGDALPSASDFCSLVAAHERLEEEAIRQGHIAARAALKARIDEMAARRLSDRDWRALLETARRAAAAGLPECVLLRFPSQLCSDGGRAINAPDSSWPQSLRGEAADIFERWKTELEPRGFRLAAQIVDFPEGMPGDAALYLMWGG